MSRFSSKTSPDHNAIYGGCLRGIFPSLYLRGRSGKKIWFSGTTWTPDRDRCRDTGPTICITMLLQEYVRSPVRNHVHTRTPICITMRFPFGIACFCRTISGTVDGPAGGGYQEDPKRKFLNVQDTIGTSPPTPQNEPSPVLAFQQKAEGWFRERAVLANVPSFRFLLQGNIRHENHPPANHTKGQFRIRAVLANVPSFRFFVKEENIRHENHPYRKPPFCKTPNPLTSQHQGQRVETFPTATLVWVEPLCD